MSSVINIFKLSILIVIAVIRRVFHRLLHGPTLPTWTWRTDIVVAVARTAITFASTVPDDRLINRFSLNASTPGPPELRHEVRIDRIMLGGCETDRYLRLGTTKDAATMLYFHGGGYVFGNPGTHRQHLARLAHATGTTVYAPRYRLAPMYKFPAALEDATKAYRALVASGTAPSDIVVAGDSAGGGLALALLLTLRDGGEPLPAGGVLFSPYTDLNHTSYTIVTNANTDYLPIAELSAPNLHYTDLTQLDNPLVSPVTSDLSGLPPILVFAGGAEMLLDDAVRLQANAERDGVEMSLVIEPEMIHIWPAMVPWEPASKQALATAASWVQGLPHDD